MAMHSARTALFQLVVIVAMVSPTTAAPVGFQSDLADAKTGNAEAQYSVGMTYKLGYGGISKNANEAAKWFKLAAVQNCADGNRAAYELGLMYSVGQGVPVNYAEATKWALNGVLRRDQQCTEMVGFIAYYEGRYIDAYAWFNISQTLPQPHPDLDLRKPLRMAEKELTSDEVLKAQALTQTLIAQISGETKPHSNPAPTTGTLLGTGSGFFVSTDGFLATNWHVVEGASSFEVLSGSRRLEAALVGADRENDLAILRVIGAEGIPLSIESSSNLSLGAQVFTVGFPNPTLQGYSPKYTDGTISSLNGIGDDPRYFQISVAVQPGNSGGPLVNSNGTVVGVITAKLSAAAAIRTTGLLPENVNYAVKSDHLLRLLQRLDIHPTSEGQNGATPQRRVEDAAVLISCYR